jgi:phage shock protein C
VTGSYDAPQRTSFYRDKINGKFMGVCAGIADYTGIDVLWVRLGFLILAFSMGWPFFIYFALGFLAAKKPAAMYADRAEEKFWQGVRQSPARTAREVRSSFRDIDRRLAEVEQFYVSGNPRLSAEIEKLR